jgi:hypothetical protein
VDDVRRWGYQQDHMWEAFEAAAFLQGVSKNTASLSAERMRVLGRHLDGVFNLSCVTNGGKAVLEKNKGYYLHMFIRNALLLNCHEDGGVRLRRQGNEPGRIAMLDPHYIAPTRRSKAVVDHRSRPGTKAEWHDSESDPDDFILGEEGVRSTSGASLGPARPAPGGSGISSNRVPKLSRHGSDEAMRSNSEDESREERKSMDGSDLEESPPQRTNNGRLVGGSIHLKGKPAAAAVDNARSSRQNGGGGAPKAVGVYGNIADEDTGGYTKVRGDRGSALNGSGGSESDDPSEGGDADIYGSSFNKVKVSRAENTVRPENAPPENDPETYQSASDVLENLMRFKVPEGNELGHASSMVTPLVPSGMAGFHADALTAYRKPRSNPGDQ